MSPVQSQIDFQIPLARPLSLADQTLEYKKGTILVTSQSYAEISPLSDLPQEVESSKQWAEICLQSKPEITSIECNGLIDRLDLPDTDQAAKQFVSKGYRAIKLKIGTNTKLERDRIENLLSHNVLVRVDANRSLTMSQAEWIFDELDIEYAEEPLIQDSAPLKHIENLEELSMRCGVWYALDETLEHILPEQMPKLDGLKALVIKPQRLGLKALTWIEWATRSNKQIVLSSLYDTAVGLHHLAMIAKKVMNHSPANSIHGLDASHLVCPPIENNGPIWTYSPLKIRQWIESLGQKC